MPHNVSKRASVEIELIDRKCPAVAVAAGIQGHVLANVCRANQIPIKVGDQGKGVQFVRAEARLVPKDAANCAFALRPEKVASRNTPNTTDSVLIIVLIKFPFLPTMAGRRELCFLTGGNTMHGICRGDKGLVKL